MSTTSSTASFEALKLEILADHKRNREVLNRIRTKDRWLGCVGLAVGVDTDLAITVDDYDLFPNSALTWVAERGIPVGRLDVGGRASNRPVSLVSTAKAQLCYGMPAINFAASNTFDMGVQPKVGAGRNEVGAVLDLTADTWVARVGNQLTTQNLEAAIFASVEYAPNRVGPLRRDLVGLRDKLWDKMDEKIQPFYLQSMPALPEPYRCFQAARSREVFNRCTEAVVVGDGIKCLEPGCGKFVDVEYLEQALRSLRGSTTAWTDLSLLDATAAAGKFFAACPHCHKNRVWHLADAAPDRTVRKFTYAFRTDFCDAVADGLPMFLDKPGTYMGNFEAVDTLEGSTLRLAKHQFRGDDGVVRSYFTPDRAVLQIRVGDRLQKGDHWINLIAGRLLGRAGVRWLDSDDKYRWANLSDVCGGSQYVGFLQKLWFESKAVYSDGAVYAVETLGTGKVFFPAAYCVPGASGLLEDELYWSFRNVEDKYFVRKLSAYVFPPVPLRHWDDLQLTTQHETLKLDCSVAGIITRKDDCYGQEKPSGPGGGRQAAGCQPAERSGLPAVAGPASQDR